MNTLVSPAHTYAKPSGAVNAVQKMQTDRGGKEVRFVIGKDPKTGRYYPVFVERIKQISELELAENPSANQTRRVVKKTARAKPAAKKATKKPAKKAAGRRKNTLH